MNVVTQYQRLPKPLRFALSVLATPFMVIAMVPLAILASALLAVVESYQKFK